MGDERIVDAARLNALLRPRHPDVEVAQLDVLGAHEGSASRLRLSVEYEPGRSAGLPSTMFLKRNLARFEFPTEMYSTEVRVWYSSTAIFFGIRAFEPHGAVAATEADRDRIAADDNVEIHLDTFDERNRAFVFIVNPLDEPRQCVGPYMTNRSFSARLLRRVEQSPVAQLFALVLRLTLRAPKPK